MPLLREPTTQELEEHFFGAGAFGFGWFQTYSTHFPAIVDEFLDLDGPIEEDGDVMSHTVTEQDFVRGIKLYAEMLTDRTFDDLIEDMDAGDVDACIQLAIFGEIVYG